MQGKQLPIVVAIAASFFSQAPAIAGEVNVNTASAETIADELTGVGKAKADAIIAYRKKHGSFANVEDLLHVQGIGPRILEENAGDIRLRNEADD